MWRWYEEEEFVSEEMKFELVGLALAFLLGVVVTLIVVL